MTASLPKALLLLAMCACSLAQAQNAPSRIGFVFTERLYTESKLAKIADAKIEAEFSKRQKAKMEMAARVKAMSDKFDAEAPNLPEPERTRRLRELLDIDKDLQRTEREFREDLMQRKNEERSIIAQKAYKLIEQIAEQEKLDVVLQEAAWSSPRIDITDKILKQLDK
jgi:outer membrane protein